MKRCPKCKEWKPTTLEFFYKDKRRKDGLYCRCKKCHIAAAIAWNQGPKGQAHKQSPIGKAMKAASERRYRQTPKGKAYRHQEIEVLRRNHPNRYKARRAVNNAVRDGKLPPINIRKCINCDRQAEHYHHDNGYDEKNRLNVIPVCRDCHQEYH